MSEQPEALRLADALNEKPDSDGHCREAAAELRRLHEANRELLEALKLALEALVAAFQGKDKTGQVTDAITALREALAEQPAQQQEPLAWKNAAIRLGEELSSVGPDGYYDMTAEQWLDWAMDQHPQGKNSFPAQQQEQKPVAWRYNGNLHEFDPSDWATGPVTPLYTSPPASKPWVGLVMGELPEDGHNNDFLRGAVWAEAKLRGKNT